MFKKAAFLFVLCGMLMLSCCSKPDTTQTAAVSSQTASATSSAESEENASSAAATEWIEMNAPGLQTKFERPETWVVRNAGMSSGNNWPWSRLAFAIDGIDNATITRLVEPIDLSLVDAAEFAEVMASYYVYGKDIYYDENAPVERDVTILNSTAKFIGDKDVVRISIRAQLIEETYIRPEDHACFGTIWLVTTKENRTYIITCSEDDDTFIRIPEIERIIQSMVFTGAYHYEYDSEYTLENYNWELLFHSEIYG